MNLRQLVAALEARGELRIIDREVDPRFELAALAAELDGSPVLFRRVHGHAGPVVVGLCSTRERFALAMGVEPAGLLPLELLALQHPVEPSFVDGAPCQEVVDLIADLGSLPILTHLEGDGGPYVTSGIAIVRDPELGLNVSYHRLMRIGVNRLVARIVEGRGTATALARSAGDLPIAICIGAPLSAMLAAAMSPAKGVSELSIANALSPTPVVRCVTSDLLVPAETEYVLEGRVTRELAREGPFIDLTQTWDIVRDQPVIEIDCITHRRDPVYHALLPGLSEHRMLMGMPREPTMYAEVGRVADCRDVRITPAGASWLHAVVQIRKAADEDGHNAVLAAFRGHGSLKHVVVVDDDIDIDQPSEVEWAVATRFQAGRGLVVLLDEPGSSLDPSATHRPGEKSRTSKMGLDATIPWRDTSGRLRTPAELAEFLRVQYPKPQTC